MGARPLSRQENFGLGVELSLSAPMTAYIAKVCQSLLARPNQVKSCSEISALVVQVHPFGLSDS